MKLQNNRPLIKEINQVASTLLFLFYFLVGGGGGCSGGPADRTENPKQRRPH